MSNTVSRRGFVVGCVAFVAAGALGFAAKTQFAQAAVLRPPGALAEKDFLARCVKCYRCISVCPTHVLRPLAIEAGVVQSRTPTITFAQAECTFCNKCSEVCPTLAIKPTDPYKPELGRIGLAQINTDKCLAYLDSTCRVCAERCIYGAISLDGAGRPHIDDTKCNGCGICEKSCPVLSMRSFTGSNKRGVEVVVAAVANTALGAVAYE